VFTLTVSRRKAWITAVVVLVGAIWLVRDDAQAGTNPPAEGIDVVYVAVSTNFPDALGVGPGAGVNNAPIILVPTDPPLPGYTSDELVRLDPRKVIIVGGTGVVSQAMEDAVASLLPYATIERLAGSNRYETNTLITQSIYPIEAWASIHAVAFDTESSTDSRFAYYEKGYGSGFLYAPIPLPHGATIREVRLSGYDSNVGTDYGDDVAVTLYRVHNSTGPEGLAVLSSTGAPGNFVVSTSSFAPVVVDNANYSYLIGVSGATDESQYLRNVMVRYELGTPGA
jgi:hypothetical protein